MTIQNEKEVLSVDEQSVTEEAMGTNPEEQQSVTSGDEAPKKDDKNTATSLENEDLRKNNADSPDSMAILFVRKFLNAASNKFWVDIEECQEAPDGDFKKLHFSSVTCGLYPRETKPSYPNKDEYYLEHFGVKFSDIDVDSLNKSERQKYDGVRNDLYNICRHITGEVSAYDIQQQKDRGYQATKFEILADVVEIQPPEVDFNEGEGDGDKAKKHRKSRKEVRITSVRKIS